ncbi:unnamed protein product [Adineta ricciae]|uniref:Uncharacterized protein n=1 Tax=Adineta ricciae TaxID=249248 RepID=A0A814WBL0_ADIRI|nr:unnamed protein product [Adineta ricciae]CAF1200129.1 unnamed protein product [Adineta ricciae]
MKAAFDSIWHNGLICKLNDLRLLYYILHTADSMNDIPSHTEPELFANDTAVRTSTSAHQVQMQNFNSRSMPSKFSENYGN